MLFVCNNDSCLSENNLDGTIVASKMSRKIVRISALSFLIGTTFDFVERYDQLRKKFFLKKFEAFIAIQMVTYAADI